MPVSGLRPAALFLFLLFAACRPPGPQPAPEAKPQSEPETVAAPEPAIPFEPEMPLVDVPPVPAALQPVEEFEDRALPAGYSAEGGGDVRITTRRSKSGVRSLVWHWERSTSSLWIRRPDDLALWSKLKGGDRQRATLAFWCHRDKPGGLLTIEVHSETGIVARCWFRTGYRGWRALGAPWNDVLGSAANQKIVAIRIRAPEGEESGELHLDRVGLFCAERPNADAQQPWIGVASGLTSLRSKPSDPYDYAVGREWLPRRLPENEITPAMRADAEKIKSRLAGNPTPVPPTNKVHKTDRMAQLEGLMAKYKIREQDGCLAGTPIQGMGFHQPPGALHISTVYSDLGQLGHAFRQTGDAGQRGKIRAWIRSLCALTVDHGWAPDNANFGYFTAGYGERGWADNLFVCREAIEGTPEWDDMLRQVAWFWGAEIAVRQRPWGDTDIHLNGTPRVIHAIARMSAGPEKIQLLQIFKRYVDLTYQQDNLIALDGTAHHHGMFHLAYASYSVPSMMAMAQWLEGTVFQIEDATLERLKKYVRTVADATNLYSIPANVNGRAGNPLGTDISGMALSLARFRGPLDREMAAIFLAKNSNPRNSAVADFQRLEIPPASLAGHRTLNYAAGALHRRGRWLASIFGMNDFTRGLEIYGWMDGNNYGRYARNGSVMITGSGEPRDARASGFREEGWNWCFWPGATTLERPSHEMYSYYALFGLGGSSVLSGGTTLGSNGVWAIDFRGQDVDFRKSVFCFDNRITVVTRDIKSKSGRPAVTTLFQNSLATTNAPTGVNGRGGLKYFQSIVKGTGAWLFDTQRNGYVVPPGQAPVRISRGAQAWTCMFDRYLKDPKDNPLTKQGTRITYRHPDRAQNEAYYRPLTGNFERAWFEHGTNPTNGACWYTIFVDTKPEAVESWYRAMADPVKSPIRLLQANAGAHVLVDNAARSVGYVIFDPAARLATSGPVVSVSMPCALGMEMSAAGARVGVSSPDPERKAPIEVKLRGAWAVDAADGVVATRETDATLLHLSPTGIMPLEFRLRREASLAAGASR